MTLDERAMSVAYEPLGDFTKPHTQDERSLRHYIPIYLASFRCWADNTTRNDSPDRSSTEARTFDWYLDRAFARAEELDLLGKTEFLDWQSQYTRDRNKFEKILGLEEIAA